MYNQLFRKKAVPRLIFMFKIMIRLNLVKTSIYWSKVRQDIQMDVSRIF
ncbi:hypothetical protein BLA29_001196 [Euroglyphus maynei]|uniref:Uncharacterized protein n=1 Tax=Euroglyphus maynei TaxID=6958 RepID=A0A1Y3BU68_EURMA|nr:hypothetical protein BLA29_001196 [Euroglyphus maynei]